jgi:hypothetical protein
MTLNRKHLSGKNLRTAEGKTFHSAIVAFARSKPPAHPKFLIPLFYAGYACAKGKALGQPAEHKRCGNCFELGIVEFDHRSLADPALR